MGEKKKKKWHQYELIEMVSIKPKKKKKKVTTSIGGDNTPKPTSLTEQRDLQEHCSGRLNNTEKYRLDAILLGPTPCYSPPPESMEDLKIKP